MEHLTKDFRDGMRAFTAHCEATAPFKAVRGPGTGERQEDIPLDGPALCSLMRDAVDTTNKSAASAAVVGLTAAADSSSAAMCNAEAKYVSKRCEPWG